jgi:hypothetical protein
MKNFSKKAKLKKFLGKLKGRIITKYTPMILHAKRAINVGTHDISLSLIRPPRGEGRAMEM